MKAGVKVLKDFLRNTSMHGFKYILSPFYFDRIWWVLWCGVGGACAGALCSNLWARFVDTPALLVRMSLTSARYQPMPRVAICPTPDYVTNLFADNMSINKSESTWLPPLLRRLLNAKPADEKQLQLLDRHLMANNLTLSGALMSFMPACGDLLTRCRWQDVMLPCEQLFAKKITPWGVCCDMKSEILPEEIMNKVFNGLKINQQLELVLQCSNYTMPYGCRFFTKYQAQGYIEPAQLLSGSYHLAQVEFTLVQDEDPEKVVEGKCVSVDGYSRRRCLTICKDRICGCSSPLNDGRYDDPPPECSAVRINCLLGFDYYKNPCNCAPSCRQVSADLTVESAPLDALPYTYDPIYEGLNETTSIVLKLLVRTVSSKLFYSMPSETWLTLMSSIGGAFSVFLGVGFFSAAEILFYFFYKLPVALMKSSKAQNPVTTILVKERPGILINKN